MHVVLDRAQDQTCRLQHAHRTADRVLVSQSVNFVRHRDPSAHAEAQSPRQPYRKGGERNPRQPREDGEGDEGVVRVSFERTVGEDFLGELVVFAKGLDQKRANDGRFGGTAVVRDVVNDAGGEIRQCPSEPKGEEEGDAHGLGLSQKRASKTYHSDAPKGKKRPDAESVNETLGFLSALLRTFLCDCLLKHLARGFSKGEGHGRRAMKRAL